jgi:lysophospholipase L1-like esterase
MKRFRLRSALLDALLVFVSVAVCFAGLELFLWIAAAAEPPVALSPPAPAASPAASGQLVQVPEEITARATARYRFLTMPEEWEQRPAQVPDATWAYYWHGVLHVHNADTMRRIGPFPPKAQGVYRVMVVGDSLTYGYGIEQSATFVELLNSQMGRDFKIEFLNLGVSGYQSEDVLKTIKKFLPTLNPDLVVYAICLNDFLPSGIGEYHYSYAVPIPKAIKDFFLKHTRSAAYLSDLYDGALRRLHIRQDFFDDILSDFAGYQQRFERDVQDMNASILAAGLPPLVAMVVDQYPGNPPGKKITAIAEESVLKAGATLIPTADYYRSYPDQSFYVSRWEGHPNEVANYIWAHMISEALRPRPDLQPFARDRNKAAIGDAEQSAQGSKINSAK